MIQKKFADRVCKIIKEDDGIIGLTVGGSWITNQLDEFSDLDLILITKEKLSTNREIMHSYADKFGKLLTCFTGEHIGDSRVLICLYDNPLLHVDIKFLTLEEFHNRVEDPEILFERNNHLTNILTSTKAIWPERDFQWFEDRVWVWIHFTAAKIGRGEYFESLTALHFMIEKIISPLLNSKYGKLQRGTRRIEAQLNNEDFVKFKSLIAEYDRDSILIALNNFSEFYKSLRHELFPPYIMLRTDAERRSLEYLNQLNKTA